MASRLFLRPALALRPTASPALRRSFAVSSSRQIKESSGGKLSITTNLPPPPYPCSIVHHPLTNTSLPSPPPQRTTTTTSTSKTPSPSRRAARATGSPSSPRTARRPSRPTATPRRTSPSCRSAPSTTPRSTAPPAPRTRIPCKRCLDKPTQNAHSTAHHPPTAAWLDFFSSFSSCWLALYGRHHNNRAGLAWYGEPRS